MKKILILANNDVGLYKFRRNLIEELLKENQVYISLPFGEYVDDLVSLGCSFINTRFDRRAINPITDLFLLFKYYTLLNRLKPDLVITYTIKPNIYGGIASRIKNISYVANITGLGKTFQKDNLLKKVIINMYKISLKRCKTVFFENSENLSIFVKNKIVELSRTVKLNGAGVDLDEYSYCQYPNTLHGIRFLFIGRIMKEKGVDELFESAKIIKNSYSDVYFDIVGPMEEDYSDKLALLEAEGIIEYYGFQKDVKSFIKSCHCFVLPSYHEGMANTLLESAAIGRPLIASNIYGCKEAIVDGVNGFIVESQDAADLVNQIRKFIELEYYKKEKMSFESRELVKAKFNKKDVVRETLKALFDD